jgi:HEAT repeat protein
LKDFDDWNGTDSNAPAVVAVRALGTSAIPTLVKMSLWRDSGLKDRVSVEFEKHPELMRYRYTIAAQRWARAGQALSIMGEPARAAVPYYLRALTNEDAVTRRIALNALGSIGPPAEDSIPALLARQNDIQALGNLMGTLGNIGRRADLCVPLLIQELGDTNDYVRQSAAYALGRFGGQAKAAIPSLTQALSDKHMARAATAALKKIQSEEEMSTNGSDPK